MQIQPLSVLAGALINDSKFAQRVLVGGALVFAFVRALWWGLKHPVHTLPFIIFLAATVHFWSWKAGLVWFFIAVAVAVWWRLFQLLRYSEIDSWAKLFRGLPRLRYVLQAWEGCLSKLRPKLEIEGELPLLLRPLVTHTGIAGIVDTSVVAKDAGVLKQYERDLAAALRCDRVIFEPFGSYLAEVRVDWGRHLARTLAVGDVPAATSRGGEWPENVAFGLTESGGPAEVAANESILAGGITGSGKSSFAWAYIAGLIESGIPFRLRVCDGSGMEFVELKKVVNQGLVHDYVSGVDQDALEAFFKRAEKAMATRMAWCEARDIRLFVPTPEHPLDVMIVDESIPISEQLRVQGVEHPISRIAYLGRKSAQVVVMLTQAGQKDVMGKVRDLFPRRISFRTASRVLTEVVLGDGAEKEGAKCSALHEKFDRGVGVLGVAGGFAKFRTPWISDEHTRVIASGALPEAAEGSLVDAPTTLYRRWGPGSRLLYVGIVVTGREAGRWGEHERSKPWWGTEEEGFETTLEYFPDRREAKAAETLAIKREKPLHNIAENQAGRRMNRWIGK